MTTFGSSILFLCPHPDDEVVACCAAIGRAKAQGARVTVIFLTHGCVEQDAMWPWARGRYDKVVARRRDEAMRAAELLGLEVAGWSDRPARHLWRNLAQAETEVRRAVEVFGVDQIWTPAFEGGNPDHDGANAIASRFAAEGMSVLEFAEYHFHGGRVSLHRFLKRNGEEQWLRLGETERSLKRRALKLYASEWANLIFVRPWREVFRPLAVYDYGKEPHEGLLWYARFQWVPFRHPRVDFTHPSEVTGAIATYIAAAASRAVARPVELVKTSLTISADA